jgi:hypothetical protein
VRIPADVDREDRLLAGLTARQLAYVSAGALALAGLWVISRPFVPAAAFLVAASPVAAFVALLALGRRDGLPADRLAAAWLRHATANRRLVPAPEGVPALPVGVPRVALPAPLGFPVQGVAPTGVLDLGDDGMAVVCRASSLNFGLRTEAEQEALVASFARWLNSLTSPVQIVVRAERVDVAGAVASLRDHAKALPSAALEGAALLHAQFLSELAERRDVLRRVVLLVFREPAGDGTADLLLRRVEEAASALAGAGVTVSALDEAETVAALGAAADPHGRPRPAGLARPGEVIRGASA